MKPFRSEFRQEVKERFPGCLCTQDGRGMNVTVATKEQARSVERMAHEHSLTLPDEEPESDGPESFTVRVHGFRRGGGKW